MEIERNREKEREKERERWGRERLQKDIETERTT